MIYVLYGQPSSGKTTLGQLIAARESIPIENVIDGDALRTSFKNRDYSKQGRIDNIKTANLIATYLHQNGRVDVVVSLVNPFEELRKELRKLNGEKQVLEILLKPNRGDKKEFHVEQFEEGNPDFKFDTNRSVQETWDMIGKEVFGDVGFRPYGKSWFAWRENSKDGNNYK